MEKALRLSLEQSQREKGVAGGEMGGAGPGGGKAGGMKVKKGALVSKGTIDALAAEKHGRWFSFDDRKVSYIVIWRQYSLLPPRPQALTVIVFFPRKEQNRVIIQNTRPVPSQR